MSNKIYQGSVLSLFLVLLTGCVGEPVKSPEEVYAINRAAEVEAELVSVQADVTVEDLSGIWVAYIDSTGTYAVENSDETGTYHYEHLDYFKVIDNGDSVDTVGCHRFDGPKGGYFNGLASFTKQDQSLLNEKMTLSILSDKQLKSTQVTDAVASSSSVTHYSGHRYTWWFKISGDNSISIGGAQLNAGEASEFDCLLVKTEEEKVTEGTFVGELLSSISINGEVSGSASSIVSITRSEFPLGDLIARNVAGSLSDFGVMGSVDDYTVDVDTSSVLSYKSLFTDLNTAAENTIDISILSDE